MCAYACLQSRAKRRYLQLSINALKKAVPFRVQEMHMRHTRGCDDGLACLRLQTKKLESDAAERSKNLEALTVKASNEASAAKSAKAELDKIQLELVELKYVTH